MKFLKQKLFLLSILLISGCSTLDGLRFWENDEVLKDINLKISAEEKRRNQSKMLLDNEIKIISKNEKLLQEFELNASISKSKVESSKL